MDQSEGSILNQSEHSTTCVISQGHLAFISEAYLAGFMQESTSFLGLYNCESRVYLYKQVVNKLGMNSADFFIQNRGIIFL